MVHQYLGRKNGIRRRLLASAAVATLGIAAQAQAQDVGDLSSPDFALHIAQGAPAAPDFAIHAPQGATPDFSENTPQIVVEGPGEGHSLYPGEDGTVFDDDVDVTGVGQFYRADGFVCTGTLINPRTVLFAAHCVNDLDPEDYGAATGGIPAVFAFQADAYDGLIDWISSGFQSNPELFTYNVNQILYNPASVARPEGLGFLEGDVALASLDLPASNVPTWAVLFSPLPAPDGDGDAGDGTGYHVRVNGYGVTGYGNGPVAANVDYRRRAAENMLGVLGSLDDTDIFIFGGTSVDPDDPTAPLNPQNLYQLDFDDPNRTNPYDFDLFRDDAEDVEGITGGGDSGGPLILDNSFDEEVVLGVLSGGSRYFVGQPYSTYGTSSFYQPLYLFWDWIAANSPYRYTAAKAGDGKWSDPDHWVTALDPNFRVIDGDGHLVNDIPDTPGAGVFGDDDSEFGRICNGGYCYDLATGDYVDYDGNVLLEGDIVAGEGETEDLPDPTLENGLPGASGYVPNNIDPDVIVDAETGETTIVNARYFDVTLAAAGTTTLDTEVTVDRFKLAGLEAALDVTADGSLTSLVDINQIAGMLNVDGTVSTGGDYFLMTGMLSGTGTVNTPYFTNLMGIVSPGTMGTIGELTFNGNVILSSGSTYAIDIGEDGASDRITVNAAAETEEGEPIGGMASIGGAAVFHPVEGALIRDGDSYTILTAEGGIDGTFDAATSISAILRPELSYSDTAVMAEIVAGSYADVIDSSSSVQRAYAGLLDQNRSQYARFADLYGPLDILDAAAIQSSLEGFAPRTQAVKGAMGTTAIDVTNRFIRERMAKIGSGGMGGTLAMYGQPVALASAAATNPASAASVATAQSVEREGVLADDASAFLAGGYIDGDSASMPLTGGRDEFDGWYIAGGLEKAIAPEGAVGVAFSYTDLDGTTPVAGHSAKGKLYQGTLYAVNTFAGGIRLDTQITAGAFDTRTRRDVTAGSANYQLTADDTAFVFSSEVGLGKVFGLGGFDLTPRAAFRATHLGFTPTAERGGGPALQYNLGHYNSVQGRAGINLAGTSAFRPFVDATYVHDFMDRPGSFGANFVGGIGPNAIFALPGTDQDYGEISGGLGYSGGGFDISVAAQTTIARDDVSYQSYRGTVTFHF